ncbi:hypothetical protein CHARACLAT_012199, partial [Characodon lateralis]|nr:hypothetical protein [Characodon lateralis]
IIQTIQTKRGKSDADSNMMTQAQMDTCKTVDQQFGEDDQQSYSSSSTFSRTGLRGQQTQVRHPDVPLPRHQGVPRPAERHSPSSVSWAILWASSWWDVPGKPPKEGVPPRPEGGTHPPVSILVKRDHHPSLPIQRHCPRLPHNVEEACQTAPQHTET